jgi:hypothetical protein
MEAFCCKRGFLSFCFVANSKFDLSAFLNMSTLSIQSPAGTSTSSSSVSAAGRAVAALNSPRMDDLSSNSDITRETSAESEQPVAANKTQEKKSSWFWSQWASQTGEMCFCAQLVLREI